MKNFWFDWIIIIASQINIFTVLLTKCVTDEHVEKIDNEIVKIISENIFDPH